MLETTGDGTNTGRGRVYRDSDGDVMVWDSESATTTC